MIDEFYFAPDDDCLTPLLQTVSDAKDSILVADYSFSLPPLTDLLIAKHIAGVKVKIVLDKSQSGGKSEQPEIEKLKTAGVDYIIGESDRHRIMHLKVCVIDSETTVFGSYNFTEAAALENNVLAIFDDSDISQSFTKAINKAYLYILQNQAQGLSLSRGETMQLLNYLKVHFPAIAAGVVTVFTVLQETNAINVNPKWFVTVNALLLAFGLTTVHIRQQVQLKGLK